MSHKLLWLKSLGFLSLAVLIFIAAMSLGCGSSGSNPTVCRTVYNPVGNWQITVSQSEGGSVAGYGAIDTLASLSFFDTNALYGGTGDTVELPVISGNCSFSGNLLPTPSPAPTLSIPS